MSQIPESFRIVDAVAEMGVVRMRMGIGNTAAESYRPRMCLWVDHENGAIVHFQLGERRQNYLPLVLNSLSELARRRGGAPRQIQLRDPKLAGELRTQLATSGIEVVVRESLPMLDRAVADMLANPQLNGEPEPGLLDQPGMTLDHVMAFADAGKVFFEARPWRHLIDDDLIAIESPAGPSGTNFTQVLGAAGQTFGLGFVPTRKAHEDLRTGRGFPRGAMWNLLFGELDELEFNDGETWECHALPVASPTAYPCFCQWSKSKGRMLPTPQQLVWAEGLLRALAASTEDEFDRGQWEKTVQTLVGPAVYRFSLPLLLEQMAGKRLVDPAQGIQSSRLAMESMLRAVGQQIAARGEMTDAQMQKFMGGLRGDPPPFVPKTDAERAQALCYKAYESRGRRQVQLARQALAIDPDCCDALLLLAERADGPELAVPLMRRAVEAGARQLGQKCFDEDAGHFWGVVETRPYMRARQQLGLALMNLDAFDEAAGHFQEMLRLNPGDNQGNRYHLAQCLLNADRLDELDALLNRSDFRDDFGAEWIFTRTLLEYRRSGDSSEARRRLLEARLCNPYVEPLLTGIVSPPPIPPDAFSPGSEEEAIICFEQISRGWKETAGAVDWLKTAAPKMNRQAKQWQREREKKRKKR